MTKQVGGLSVLAVLTTLLALLILWQFRIVVIYVLISLTFAAAIRPLVQRLVGRTFVNRMAWILLYLLVLGGFVFLVIPDRQSHCSLKFNPFPKMHLSGMPGWFRTGCKAATFQKTLFARIAIPE